MILRQKMDHQSFWIYNNRWDKKEDEKENSSKEDDLSDTLNNLLKSDSEKSRSISNGIKQDINSPVINNIPIHPPTLTELEAQGQYQRTDTLRNLGNPSYNDQEIEDKKRELLFRFSK